MLLRGKNRSVYNALSSIRYPPDRGLDHSVGRERHLKPICDVKNLISSEPSKSAPLSLLCRSKENLGIPFRPVEFIRKYPSIFQEFHLGASSVHPHVKLTPEVLSLSSEETLLYQSVSYKQEMASRLLKLLMISRIRRIPIYVVDRLSWELGLPHDFIKSIVPEFPDYFRIISGNHLSKNEKIIELVFWSDEFAVSEVERSGSSFGNMNIALQYSNGSDMEKKYKNWLEDWHKLPYLSPYENAMHLASKTNESDKWAVAVLHEVLNLFVGKKAERETLLCLGEFWGLRSRFKLAILQHPEIFYVSKRTGIHTVVLREAYRRGMLIKRHPLMDVRIKYGKLMNLAKANKNPAGKKKETSTENTEGKELDEGGVTDEDDDQTYDSSDEDHLEAANVTNRARLRRKTVGVGYDSNGRQFARRNVQ